MAGPIRKEWKRTDGPTTYFIDTVEDSSGNIGVTVRVPGLPPRRDDEQAYATEGEALAAGDRIAKRLITHLN